MVSAPSLMTPCGIGPAGRVQRRSDVLAADDDRRRLRNLPAECLPMCRRQLRRGMRCGYLAVSLGHGTAFLLGGAAPDAGLPCLQGVGQAQRGDRATPADSSRSADLRQRGTLGSDGKEEVGILGLACSSRHPADGSSGAACAAGGYVGHGICRGGRAGASRGAAISGAASSRDMPMPRARPSMAGRGLASMGSARPGRRDRDAGPTMHRAEHLGKPGTVACWPHGARTTMRLRGHGQCLRGSPIERIRCLRSQQTSATGDWSGWARRSPDPHRIRAG